jgi:hypothetical protein
MYLQGIVYTQTVLRTDQLDNSLYTARLLKTKKLNYLHKCIHPVLNLHQLLFQGGMYNNEIRLNLPGLVKEMKVEGLCNTCQQDIVFLCRLLVNNKSQMDNLIQMMTVDSNTLMRTDSLLMN